MELTFGDIQETALIPLAIKASETSRPNARIRDKKAKEIKDALGMDVSKYDPFMSHEGVIARTIMYRETLENLLKEYLHAAGGRSVCGGAPAIRGGAEQNMIVRKSSPLRGFLIQSHFAPGKVNFAPFWVHL